MFPCSHRMLELNAFVCECACDVPNGRENNTNKIDTHVTVALV